MNRRVFIQNRISRENILFHRYLIRLDYCSIKINIDHIAEKCVVIQIYQEAKFWRSSNFLSMREWIFWSYLYLIYSLVVPEVHWGSYEHSRIQMFILSYLAFKTLQSAQKWLVAVFHCRIILTSVERVNQNANESLDYSVNFITEQTSETYFYGLEGNLK